MVFHLAIFLTLLATPTVNNASYPHTLTVSLFNGSELAGGGKDVPVTKPSPRQNNLVKNKHQNRHEQAKETSPSMTTEDDVSENTIPEQPDIIASATSIASGASVATIDTDSSASVPSGNAFGNGSGDGYPPTISETRFGERGAPAFIYQAVPEYPPLARRLGKEGRVLLKLLIDADGKLLKVEVIKADGYGFTEASVAAVKKSTYVPGSRNGVKTVTWAILPLRFRLE